MKKSVIFLICLILSLIAIGQSETKNLLDEVEVTPPKFTGIENVAAILDADNSLLVNNYLKNYVKENFVCPKNAAEVLIKGTEIVQFTVTPTGEVTNFKVINSVCDEIDKEVIRVLETTDGMWKPGYNNGEPIAMEKEVAVMIGDYRDSEIVKYFTQRASVWFSEGNKNLFIEHKPKKALRHYNKGVRYLPYDKALLLLRGICHYELGDKESAERDWNRIAFLGGIDPDALENDITEVKGYAELKNILESKKN